MKNTSLPFDSNVTITTYDIKEALRLIGIKETTANVFTLPKKLTSIKK